MFGHLIGKYNLKHVVTLGRFVERNIYEGKSRRFLTAIYHGMEWCQHTQMDTCCWRLQGVAEHDRPSPVHIALDNSGVQRFVVA